MKVVADIETNKLENPDKIWCIVAQDIVTNEEYIFERVSENPEPFKEFAKGVEEWIGHNFLGYDAIVLNDLIDPNLVDYSRVFDTLVFSRLLNAQIEGGHSIASWAPKLGAFTKVGKDISDWSVYTPEMLSRCRNDVKVNRKLYDFFNSKYLHRSEFADAYRLEHSVAILCNVLHSNGFPFNLEEAKRLYQEWSLRLAKLDEHIKESFPPRAVLVRQITPKLTKLGTINRSEFRWYGENDFNVFYPDAPFSLIEWQEFNPASPKQIVERLNEAGWKPVDKTKGHTKFLREAWKKRKENKEDYEVKAAEYKKFGWSISDANLQTLPPSAPDGARFLSERLLLASRVSDLEEWIALAQPSKKFDGAWEIHGKFFHIGAWTHRMSHSQPNMANIPSVEELRQLWEAPKGFKLVGTDADGIQMRIFAHYVNDERLINAIVKGSKEDKTDIHSLHQQALGPVCKSRDNAKTFIYAFLLGAAAARVSDILNCSLNEAKEAIEKFLDFYPGLQDLKKTSIPRDVQRGYFVGLDGRLVVVKSEHLALGGYLQNGESIIMKKACVNWTSQLNELQIPYYFVDFVHDEWQTLIPDNKEIEEIVTTIQKESIRSVGRELKLNIPLDAQSITGYNWLHTH